MQPLRAEGVRAGAARGTGQPLRELLVRRAHTRTSAPGARNRTASPASGSTPSRDPYADDSTYFVTPVSVDSGPGQRLCGMTRVLPQAPRCAID